jgi:hypothetical protein
MKKHLLLIFFALIVAVGNAQFLPKAGLSMATTSSTETSGSTLKEKLKAGFVVGAGYNIQLGNFAIQPELLFIQKGSEQERSYSYGPYPVMQTTKLTLNYLELPVLFKYFFGPDALRFYAQFGPSFAVGLGGSGSYQLTEDFGNGPVTISSDVKVKFESRPVDYNGYDKYYIEKKTDTGLQLGGGVVVAKRIVADVRYGLGFTDWGNEETTKNRALQISVGILIGR